MVSASELNHMRTYLDFEKPIAELESKVAELRSLTEEDDTVVDLR